VKSDRATGYVLVSPAFLIIFLAMIAPLFFGLIFSLFNYQFGTGTGGLGTFAFLSNYRLFFTNPLGLQSLKVTILFTIMALGGELVIGLLIANLLMRVPAGLGSILRALYCIPMLISPIVVGLIWRYMYDPFYGMVYNFLGAVGLKSLFGGLSSPGWALVCIAVTDMWETTPFMLLVLTAGLAAIPAELYEASDIDGAGQLRKFFSVTLPMLKKVIAVVVLVRGGDAVRVFDIIYALTAGGPANSTTSLSIYAFKEGFIKYQMGYAMAISLLTLALLAGVFGPLTRVTTNPERLR
jgi:ABC-type sugar transport system permease subunit